MDVIGECSSSGAVPERVCVSWIGSFSPIEKQPSSDFILYIGSTCPLLREIDLSGLKCVTREVIQQLIEFKDSQACHGDQKEQWRPLQKIHTKFVGSSKPHVESLHCMYPHVEIIA